MQADLRIAIGLAALLLLGATPALAGPDQSGSVDVEEDEGFTGVCDQPCFTARKDFEVYLAGNPDAPAGANCPAGDNTYIYQITHTGGSGTPIGFIPNITQFNLAVETDDVSSAGHIPGFGIDPTSTIVSAQDAVIWDFQTPSIANGQSSTKLFVCSPLLPGTVTDTMVSISAVASIDAPGTCVGPLFERGQPLPCTIGWWKNRYDGKKGTLKFFPGADFDAVVERAVMLSNGIFPDANALLSDLSSSGSRPIDQRARQQLAAFLLNLAAGDLFPENTKCQIDESNQISSNACGSNITVGDGLEEFFDDYEAGNFEEAKDCADDTNNGIGVVGANSGE